MIHRTLVALSSVAITALLASPALSVITSPAAVTIGASDEPSTKLEQYMEEINKGFRRLRTDLKEKSKNVASITLVRQLGDLAGKSRLESPQTAKGIPEADRAQFLVDFQLSLIDFDHKLLELERALLEGDNETAQTLRNEANELKSPAHKKFKSEPDKEGGERGGAERGKGK